DEAGSGRENCADEESEGGAPPELVVEAERQERHDRDHRDRRVLLPEVRRGALLDRAGDLLHPRVARGLLQQPPGQVQAVGDRDARTDEREQYGVVNEEVHPSSESGRTKRHRNGVSAPDYAAQTGGLPRGSALALRARPRQPLASTVARTCSA